MTKLLSPGLCPKGGAHDYEKTFSAKMENMFSYVNVYTCAKCRRKLEFQISADMVQEFETGKGAYGVSEN